MDLHFGMFFQFLLIFLIVDHDPAIVTTVVPLLKVHLPKDTTSKDKIIWQQLLNNSPHQRTPLMRTELYGGRGVPIREGTTVL